MLIPKALLDHAVRRAREESPRARTLMQSLAGQSFQIQATDLHWSIQLTVSPQGDQLSGELRRMAQAPISAAADGHEPTGCAVSGDSGALLALLGASGADALRRGRVRVSGNADQAQRFNELLRLLRPEFEPLLARVVGTSPAHLITRGLRHTGQWLQRTAEGLVTSGSDYLAHQTRDLVPEAESADRLHATDELRERAERLAVRAQQLTEEISRLESAHGGKG